MPNIKSSFWCRSDHLNIWKEEKNNFVVSIQYIQTNLKFQTENLMTEVKPVVTDDHEVSNRDEPKLDTVCGIFGKSRF